MREHLRIEEIQHDTPPLVRFGVGITHQLTSRFPRFPSALEFERVAAALPEGVKPVDHCLKVSD